MLFDWLRWIQSVRHFWVLCFILFYFTTCMISHRKTLVSWKRSSAVGSVANRPNNAVREGTQKHVPPKPNITNRRNAVGKIIPPVAIFKGKACRSEFADSFRSGTSPWLVLEILYKRKIRRFFIFNLLFRNVAKGIKRIIYVKRFMLLVHTGTYWFWNHAISLIHVYQDTWLIAECAGLHKSSSWK